MIETSNLFVQGIAESSRQLKAQLLKGNAAISGTIRNITINKGACGEDLFSIGSVYSSYIEVVMDECEEKLENEELLLQIGLVIGDSVEYVNVGYYTVTKPKNTAYQTTFTAVGRITAKMNCLPNNMPATPTLANLASAITETTGVAIICKGVTLAGTIEEDLTGYTCREILEVIVSVLGGFATEDSAGNIVISKFSAENPIAYNGDRTVTLPEFNDYDYVLSGVKVIKTEEWTDEDDTVHAEISYTEGTPRQTLSNKFMTAGLFSAFTDNVIGFSYRPGNIPLALGDPRLEPWDCIAFTDVNGNVYTVPCLNIVHTFDGGLSTMITAPGESETESETQTKGPIIQQLERMATQLFTAEQAILKRLTVDQADIKYANIQTLNAAVGRIDSLSGEFASFKTGEFQTLKSDQADFKETTTQKLTAVDGQITNLSGELASFKTGDFETLKAGVAEIEKAYIKAADVESIIADKGYFTEAEVENLVAGKGYITELQTETLLSDYVKITTLESNYVKTNELEAKVGTFGYLKATSLESEVGKFGYLKATSLESEVGKFGYLKTNDLEAKVGTFGYIKATDVAAQYATIDLANVKAGSITQAMIGQGVVGTAQIADGSITSAKIVELTANLITAGTLSVERLEIRGTSNSIVYALNNITGALQAQNVDTLNGEVLTPRTITADKIVTKAITANEIASRTITANNILAGEITTTELNAAEIFANAANIGKIVATDTFSNAVSANSVVVSASANASKALTDASAAQTSANAANGVISKWCYNNDTTYINGGKIYTNSIKAAQIDVADLFAKQITVTGSLTGNINRTRITSDGMEILDASGNTVASYGEKTINLGIAAEDAAINLCGGLGSIKAVAHDGGALSALGINADILKLNATEYLSLDVAETNGYSGSFVLAGTGSDAYADLKLRDGITYAFGTSRFTVPVEISAPSLFTTGSIQTLQDLNVGGDIYGYNFYGVTDRPKYNDTEIALLSDVSAAVGGNYLPLSGGTMTDSIDMSIQGKGYYLRDSEGRFPGVLQNTSGNLWIGGSSTASRQHLGKTYISAGYNSDESKGYGSVWIFVPNASNNGGTSHEVLHDGNFSTWAAAAGHTHAGYAASGHTHNYAGSASAGGAANSANKVNSNLVVKLNGGTTEGTNMFTFNGSGAKTINITPAAIGAQVAGSYAAASHTHSYLPLSGGTLTGAVNLANGTWNKAGDDAYFGDNNTAGSFAIKGLNGATNLKMVTYNGSTYGTVTWTGSNFEFSSPTDVSGTETITAKFKTSNGGSVSFGKEGPNSGSMLRFDQVDGTCRLRFRGSATAGAIVWEQPEQGAQLYVDLGKVGVDHHRIVFPSSAGTLALTNHTHSYLPLSGGTLTGHLYGQYLVGTWLQTTATKDLGSAPAKIAVLDGSGWIYYRTPAEIRSDISAGSMISANGFWGMGDPSGATNVWIRTTTQGIIPYQSGSAGSGHQSLGTSTWYFSAAYIDKVYGTSFSGTAAKATADGSGNNIVSTYATKAELSAATGADLSAYAKLSDLSAYAKIATANTYNGEQKFQNSSYCPTVTDTASGVGCAFKASRGLANEMLVDKLIMTASTGKIPFYKYTGTSNGSMTGLTEVASIDSSGHAIFKSLNVTDTRIVCLPVYNNTVSYAANVYVGTNGGFGRATGTSSRTIKHDIGELTDNDLRAEKLYDLNVVQFKYNDGIITDTSDVRYGKTLPGFIIEDMDEKYPIAIDKPGQDVKEWSWNEKYLIPPMLKLIQDQHARQNCDRMEYDERLRTLGGEVKTIHMKYDAALMKIAELEKRIDQLELAS